MKNCYQNQLPRCVTRLQQESCIKNYLKLDIVRFFLFGASLLDNLKIQMVGKMKQNMLGRCPNGKVQHHHLKVE